MYIKTHLENNVYLSLLCSDLSKFQLQKLLIKRRTLLILEWFLLKFKTQFIYYLLRIFWDWSTFILDLFLFIFKVMRNLKWWIAWFRNQIICDWKLLYVVRNNTNVSIHIYTGGNSFQLIDILLYGSWLLQEEPFLFFSSLGFTSIFCSQRLLSLRKFFIKYNLLEEREGYKVGKKIGYDLIRGSTSNKAGKA